MKVPKSIFSGFSDFSNQIMINLERGTKMMHREVRNLLEWDDDQWQDAELVDRLLFLGQTLEEMASNAQNTFNMLEMNIYGYSIKLKKFYEDFYNRKTSDPETILLYRVGGNFVAYMDDAKICGDILGLKAEIDSFIFQCHFPVKDVESMCQKLRARGHLVQLIGPIDLDYKPEAYDNRPSPQNA